MMNDPAMQQFIRETIHNVIQSTMTAQADAAAAAAAGGGDRRRKLDVKNFARVNKFDGKEADFAEYAFQLKLAMNATNKVAHDVMCKSEQLKEVVTPDQMFANGVNISELGVEIYDIIGMTVSGEALTIVRGVQDMNGAEAWRRLYRRYSPRTPARTLVKLMEVLNPGKAKTVQELASMVERWELKVNVLEKGRTVKTRS
jgi:hypothetical protein